MERINVNIREYTTIEEIIRIFNTIDDLDEEYNLVIVLYKYVALEVLPLIVALIKLKQLQNYNITLNIQGNNKYAQRIDFHSNLNIDVREDFIRHPSCGRFIEITKFNETNNIDLVNQIIRIFRDNLNIDDEVLRCMNYCLFEIVDNVDNHADSPVDGYLVAQRFRNEGIIEITFVDCGIGIHKSLTEGSNPEYFSLTEEESLEYCVRNEVTNGKGAGNGLYHTKQFIISNKGMLRIYSGNKKLSIINGEQEINDIPNFQGTIITLTINMNEEVNLNDIFGNNIPITVLEMDDFIDQKNECLEVLW